MPTYNALNVPPEAAQDGGDELLRVAVSRASGPAMSLKRGFDDPAMWGHLIAEVVKHLAQVYAMNGDAARAVPLLAHLVETDGSNTTRAMLRIDPVWDPIRDDAGFKTLVSQ